VGAGLVALRRDGWRFWWSQWFERRRGLWLAMIAVACVSVPIILTQRPRPSYLFALTATLMAVLGSAMHILTYRWPRTRDIACLALALATLLFVSPYFVRSETSRPLATAYHVLTPWAPMIGSPQGKVVIGDYASELRSYARLTGVSTVENYSILARRPARQSLAAFLDQQQISVCSSNRASWSTCRRSRAPTRFSRTLPHLGGGC
jgi:hypothetical protein